MSTDQPHRPEPPSDLELMMFFDGELEEPRRAEVAAFVGMDLRARSKVAGLRVAAAFVQNEPRPLAAADDIADLVMARISANGAGHSPVTHAHDAVSAPALGAPAPIVAPVALSLPHAPQPFRAPARPAANDNGRRLLVGLVAVVAAAAAAFAIWGQRPSGPTASTVPATQTQSPVAALGPRSAAVRPAPHAPPSIDPLADARGSGSPDGALRPEPQIDAAAVPSEGDEDRGVGVEVAAVNFGAHMGSIFYVPSGSIEAKRTTTVVWLADDAGE